MRNSGNGSSPSLSTLYRYGILPYRRLPHVVTAIGDSRVAAIFTDAAQRVLAATAPLNWANALSDQRLVINQTFGVSGDRTDQMLARLASAIGTGAGTLYIQGGLNDVGQNYPSASTSGATAFANIRTMAEAARAAGMLVIIEIEVGAQIVNSAGSCGQVNELNQRLYEYAERTPGIYLHDARPVVMQADYSATAMQYRTGYSYDAIHVNGRGAYYWGKSLASLIQSIIPQRFGIRLVNRVDAVGNGRRNYLDNPVFVPATGGVLNGGSTGTLPSSWVANKSAGATLSCSTQDDANGVGKNVVMAASFAAQGDFVRLYQDVAGANWGNGEIVEAVARVAVIDPQNVAAIYLNAQANIGGTTYDNMCLNIPSNWQGPDEGFIVTLKTKPFALPAGTKGWLTAALWATAYGAGSVTMVVHHIALRRRDSL